jgi:hypothetical protein
MGGGLGAGAVCRVHCRRRGRGAQRGRAEGGLRSQTPAGGTRGGLAAVCARAPGWQRQQASRPGTALAAQPSPAHALPPPLPPPRRRRVKRFNSRARQVAADRESRHRESREDREYERGSGHRDSREHREHRDSRDEPARRPSPRTSGGGYYSDERYGAHGFGGGGGKVDSACLRQRHAGVGAGVRAGAGAGAGAAHAAACSHQHPTRRAPARRAAGCTRRAAAAAAGTASATATASASSAAREPAATASTIAEPRA